MNTHLTIGTAVAMSAFAFTLAGNASAQVRERDEVKAESGGDLAPATHAVEVTIGTGYEQGFGKFSTTQPSLTDIGSAGGAVQLGVGYRIIPQLTLGVYGSGASFSRADQADSSTNLYSAAAGVQTDWHFLPSGQRLDPWVSLGSGWRGYWINQSAGNTSVQGMEIAKLQLGLDYRIDQAIAISPVVGADLSTFFTEATPTSNGYSNLNNTQVNTFVFAGLLGRFDIPTRRGEAQVASR
jgi:hypothetical protein